MQRPAVDGAAPAAIGEVEQLGPVEFFFISERGPVNLRELNAKQRAELDELRREPGLAGSVAQMALEQEPESEHGTLLWKRVTYHLNLDQKVGFFDVSVQREFAPGEQTRKRWVLAVAGGAPGEELTLREMRHPDPNKPHRYKLAASGSAIHLIAYYEDGVLVQDPNVYTSTPESCIDIFMVEPPAPAAVLEYDSDVDGPSDTTGTCFGRCRHPGIVATS